MKRLHVHVGVADLEQSIRFYSGLFAAEPSVRHEDYAKWQLENPRVNFAISTRIGKNGLDHLGIQAEIDAEPAELEERLAAANLPSREQKGTSCCYAKSDKHWSVDPQGIAWESFRTLEQIGTYTAAEPTGSAGKTAACCTPAARDAERKPEAKACC